MSQTTDAADLIASGYRAVSNKYRWVARIDREDWREEMARRQVSGFPGDQDDNFQQGMKWVNGLGNAAGDQYRRVYSRDILKAIEPSQFEQIRKAGAGFGWGGLNEFKPLVCRKVSMSTDVIEDSVDRYRAYMKAKDDLRYYDYSLREDSKKLAERIMTEDVSDLVADILRQEAEVARLKEVRP
jgi:hypothetical protein